MVLSRSAGIGRVCNVHVTPMRQTTTCFIGCVDTEGTGPFQMKSGKLRLSEATGYVTFPDGHNVGLCSMPYAMLCMHVAHAKQRLALLLSVYPAQHTNIAVVI